MLMNYMCTSCHVSYAYTHANYATHTYKLCPLYTHTHFAGMLTNGFCSAEDYGLSTSHYCAKCPADIHNHPYTHVTPAASWVAECYTAAEFKKAFPDACEVFEIPGVSGHTLGPDTMHNKHLGMDPYFSGSALYFLVFVMLPGVWG